jgi:Ala-tRNA(Pro) deacylase
MKTNIYAIGSFLIGGSIMTISKKLKDYLDNEKVSYKTLHHPEAYTAMEIAGAQHLPGKQVAKAIIVKADGKYLMCVLPSTYNVDFEKFKKLAKAKAVQLVSEDEIVRLFPGYEVGAQPPFGHLHGLTVFVEKHLDENDEIAINAGTHTDLVKIKWKDFVRLAKPIIGDFGKHI